MDPMDYIMHNHPRSSGHYDPVHSASNHWMSHSQHSPSYPWQAQNPSLPQSYPHHPLQPAPGPVPDPFQLGHHGGMLPPMLGLPHPHAFSENMPGAVSPRPSGRHHQAYHRNAMPPPVAPVATGTGAAHNRDGAFANQIPGRPLSFQPPAGVGIPPPLGAGANAGAEANSQQQQQQQPPQPQRPPFPPAEPSTNNFGQHSNNSPHFVPVPVPLPPNPYISTPPPRRGHFSSASTSRTTFRDIPSPTRPSPPSSTFRRSHPRQRRAAPTRIMSSEPGREDDEDAARYTHPVPGMYSPGGSDSSSDGTDENAVRHLQLMRGTISTKMVASKTTLQSLQNIKIEDLPDADRCCIICYNDYGAESPEGLRESPLRLPKCGHTFGDYCIKKWLSESDSCPYCRDKLHSEPKPTTSPSARAFMNLMRSQGLHVSSRTNANPDDLLARAMAMSYGMPGRNATPPRQPTTSGRRSPPSDAGERQRRTRARHDSGHTRELRPLSGGHSRAAHVDTPLQRAAPGAPLIGHSFVHHWDEVPSMERQQQWTRERDPMPESQTGRVASSVSSPASAIATSALSPLAPMYQPQGVFIGLADRQPLGTAPSQNPRMPDIRNSLQVEGNENATPSLTTPQELPGTIQGNSNRSW